MNFEDVKNRDDFIKFLIFLEKDFQADYAAKNKSDGGAGHWESHTVGDYLESVAAWLEDNKEFKSKKQLDWKDLAKIIEAGKHYE